MASESGSTPAPATTPSEGWVRLSEDELREYRDRQAMLRQLRLLTEMLEAGYQSWVGWKARQHGLPPGQKYYIRGEDGVFVSVSDGHR